MYGKQVEAWNGAPRSVLGEVQRSPAGNIVLRAGHELELGGSWEASEHIVLTPIEAEELVHEILELLAAGGEPHSVRVLREASRERLELAGEGQATRIEFSIEERHVEGTRVPVTFVGPDGERTESYLALERPTFRDHGEEISSLTDHHREHSNRGWVQGCPWCRREAELANELLERAEREGGRS